MTTGEATEETTLSPTAKFFGVIFRTSSYFLAALVAAQYFDINRVIHSSISDLSLAEVGGVVFCFAFFFYLGIPFMRFDQVFWHLWSRVGWILAGALALAALFLSA